MTKLELYTLARDNFPIVPNGDGGIYFTESTDLNCHKYRKCTIDCPLFGNQQHNLCQLETLWNNNMNPFTDSEINSLEFLYLANKKQSPHSP